MTDSNGRFTLSTFARSDGAVLGKHKVTVKDVPKGESDPMVYKTKEAQYQRPPKSRIPMRYADLRTSRLEAVVTKDGKNEFDFTLTD
jgi:hypothetical protein